MSDPAPARWWLTVTVTSHQPLAVGRRPQTGQIRDTWPLIPGWVLRGALAARWIREHGTPDPTSRRARFTEFDDLFDSGAVRFGPLMPPGQAPAWISAYTHKYGRPDGCRQPDPDAATLPAATAPPTVCTGCGQGLERGRGGTTQRVPGQPDATDERIHAALDHDDRPRDGQLFIRRRIPRDTTLTGRLTFPEELSTPLTALLDQPGPLLIGGNRTASGRVTLTHSAATTPTASATAATADRLVLRLHSPAVFVDDHGRPTTTPDTGQLSDILGTHTEVTAAWVRTEAIGGWHAASGLPKPTERAAMTGSVYLLRCARPPDPDRLATIATDGVGLRRHEGFGWAEATPATTGAAP